MQPYVFIASHVVLPWLFFAYDSFMTSALKIQILESTRIQKLCKENILVIWNSVIMYNFCCLEFLFDSSKLIKLDFVYFNYVELLYTIKPKYDIDFHNFIEDLT